MTQAPSSKASLSHEERTATEPRATDLHAVTLRDVRQVNDRIRTYRLAVKDRAGIKFLAGQWLDVHVPGIQKAGGFTITSAPRHAVPSVEGGHDLYLELAVQESPDNPPAAWLWQPPESIEGEELHVRVGGSFVWPPPRLPLDSIDRVVLIAGGVGINPLIAMLSHIHRHEHRPLEVSLFYSTKLPSANPRPSEVLFLPRILDAYGLSGPPDPASPRGRLEFFFTGSWDGSRLSPDSEFLLWLNSAGRHSNGQATVAAQIGRIDDPALHRALGDANRRPSSVFYVCGPPHMTDSIVAYLGRQDNVSPERVLCEKWW